MVLFLFVVMMLDINVATLRQGFTRYAPLGAVIALIVVAQIGLVVWVRKLGLGDLPSPAPKPEGYSNTLELGNSFCTMSFRYIERSWVVRIVSTSSGRNIYLSFFYPP